MQNQGQQDDKLAWLDITGLTLWRVPTTAKAKAKNVIGGNPSSSSKKSVPIGAIIGAVVGGVVLLAAIGLGIWFFRRKKSSSKSTRAQSFNDEYDATPFVIDNVDPTAQMHPQIHPQMMHLYPHGTFSASDPRSSMSTRQMSWSDTSSSVPGAYAGSLAGRAAGMMPPGVNSPINTRAPAKLAPQPEPSHHLATDAGSLGIGDATPVGEMPPTYDNSWVGSTCSGSVGTPEGTLSPEGSLARQSAYSDLKGNLMAR
ncbi:hypothetical protein CspHIS471_0701010 [Cutaneotrichosporon sp. HIS471]|nr:hypothetical protein CspHIS471_0701010 [Cutaneotrichosporon sp. HIS471]